MARKKPQRSHGAVIWVAAGLILILVFGVGKLFARFVSDGSGKKHKAAVQMVTIMKPPPPPKVEEKPPEPEVKKEIKKEFKETMIEPEAKAPGPKQHEDVKDNSPPPGKNLGLDSDGTAGSDGFGLVGNKGGAALIGGGGGGGGGGGNSFMNKYGWYAQIIQEQIRSDLLQRLQKKGGIPKGKIQATVKIVLNDKGNITKFEIVDSSGNKVVEEAVSETLSRTTIHRPPPEGMPLRLSLKITAQG